MKQISSVENQSDLTLFKGETLLVIGSIIGFLLAAICLGYVFLMGGIVPPEGNVKDAFSFNAAVGIFTLSIAAILPIAHVSKQKRLWLRWGFFITIVVFYTIETIQHFRGINPRFTRAGSIMDMVIGGFFGLASIVMIVLTVWLGLSFLKRGQMNSRPLLVLGIRYAFISVGVSLIAGVCMIILQSRYIGTSGNFIVVHGLGLHALQTLPALGWLLEKVNLSSKQAKPLLHFVGVSWSTAIIIIGAQTLAGYTIFELSIWTVMTVILLLIWLVTVMILLFHLTLKQPKQVWFI